MHRSRGGRRRGARVMWHAEPRRTRRWSQPERVCWVIHRFHRWTGTRDRILKLPPQGTGWRRPRRRCKAIPEAMRTSPPRILSKRGQCQDAPGTRGPTASLFPRHPRGETTGSPNWLPIRGIGAICGSKRLFQGPFAARSDGRRGDIGVRVSGGNCLTQRRKDAKGEGCLASFSPGLFSPNGATQDSPGHRPAVP
jgi:hypothetical protein